MRVAVLLVALFTIVVGVLGIVSPDSVTTAVLRDACRTLDGRRRSRGHGARGDPICPALSHAQDSARVGSRDVRASTLGDAPRTRPRTSDTRMGDDAYRTPARRGRGGCGCRWLPRLCGCSWPPSPQRTEQAGSIPKSELTTTDQPTQATLLDAQSSGKRDFPTYSREKISTCYARGRVGARGVSTASSTCSSTARAGCTRSS
jgi:hypothetical protein